MNQPDIILKCGFSSVNYDCVFENNKGIKLVESGHVHTVTEVKQPNEYSTITGFVIRQNSVGLPPYKVTLELNPTRNVTHCSCQCPAGAGFKCKHIAALIYYINNEETLSKTNVEQEWGKPSKSGEIKYKKGKTIEDLFPRKRKEMHNPEINPVDHKSLIKDYNISSIPCILTKMIEMERQCEVEIECKNCLTFIIDKVEENMDKSYMGDILRLQSINYINSNSGYYFPLNYNENKYFFKNIKADTNLIKQIFSSTKTQSKSSLWSEIRKNRVSASIKAHRINTCKNLSIENQENLAVSLLGNNEFCYKAKINVAYGNKFENIAAEFYSNFFNVTVLKCEVIIHSQNNWLCASPDGIVLDKGILTKIVEIKCPISCQRKPIYDSFKNVCNVSYLQYKNNQICLKKSHQYYTQCQILMYCSGLNKCDLLVYNKIDPVIITIEKDELFLKKIITRLEYFYYNFYLPNLVKL